MYFSLMAANNAGNGCQTQSTTREFGSEERFEYLSLGGLAHTRSRIFHLHENLAPGTRDTGRHVHAAPGHAHGFGSIDDQVHHNLADLAGISFYPRPYPR